MRRANFEAEPQLNNWKYKFFYRQLHIDMWLKIKPVSGGRFFPSLVCRALYPSEGLTDLSKLFFLNTVWATGPYWWLGSTYFNKVVFSKNNHWSFILEAEGQAHTGGECLPTRNWYAVSSYSNECILLVTHWFGGESEISPPKGWSKPGSSSFLTMVEKDLYLMMELNTRFSLAYNS